RADRAGRFILPDRISATRNSVDPTSADRLHVTAGRDFRSGLVVGNDDVVLVATAQPPLTADERRLGDILLGERRKVLLSPFDMPDHSVESGRGDRVHDRLVVA